MKRARAAATEILQKSIQKGTQNRRQYPQNKTKRCFRLHAELKSDLAKLHHASVVQHPRALPRCVRPVLAVDSPHPLMEPVRLEELTVLPPVRFAEVPLREGGLDVVVPVVPAEFHQSIEVVLPAHQGMLPWVPFEAHILQQGGFLGEEVRILLVVKTTLHVHPLAQRARRARHARRPVDLLVLLEVLETLRPRLGVGKGHHPLEPEQVQLVDALPGQPLTAAPSPLPLLAAILGVLLLLAVVISVLLVGGHIKLELLPPLGHVLPLGSEIGDPAAQLHVRGIFLRHVDMAVLPLVLQEALVHFLEAVALPLLLPRRPRLGILLHDGRELAQRLAQRLLQERERGGGAAPRGLGVDVGPRVPHHPERRLHALRQFRQRRRVDARDAARRPPLPAIVLPLFSRCDVLRRQ
mmetsp:Transcript_53966/g.114644  ORF Transcript_53966/g.114644 Transcript_53966/m.114644 type:complete len:409 (-) Transcript_53966:660-1886(-)